MTDLEDIVEKEDTGYYFPVTWHALLVLAGVTILLVGLLFVRKIVIGGPLIFLGSFLVGRNGKHRLLIPLAEVKHNCRLRDAKHNCRLRDAKHNCRLRDAKYSLAARRLEQKEIEALTE